MLTATLLLMLHAAPAGLLADSAPRQIHFEQMSRGELLTERMRLEALRPDVVLPMTAITIGLEAMVACVVIFLGMASAPFGIAVYAAAIFLSVAGVSFAVAIAGAVRMVFINSQRREIESQLDAIDTAWGEGRCRSEPGEPPCNGDPKTSSAPAQGLLLARF